MKGESSERRKKIRRRGIRERRRKRTEGEKGVRVGKEEKEKQ